jgi:hypothetical protein
VERSDTHQLQFAKVMGFAKAQPILRVELALWPLPPALHTQNVNRLPTAVGASASGKAFASAAMARQPVQ